MAEYFLAPSLVRFRESVNKAYPKRDKSSDGWIGDASHAARASEHNPCWTCSGYQYGIVRAIDVDIDDNTVHDLRKEILNSTIGHRAVWYVISNGVIYSRTYDWAARRYTGTNQHLKHVHISIQRTEAAARDTTLLLRTATAPAVGGGGGAAPVVDRTITVACIARLAQQHLPVSGQCLYDNDQLMSFAVRKRPVLAGTTRPYYIAMTKAGNWAEAGRMIHYAVRCIQAAGGLLQDGIIGPKTAQYLKNYGFTIK